MERRRKAHLLLTASDDDLLAGHLEDDLDGGFLRGAEEPVEELEVVLRSVVEQEGRDAGREAQAAGVGVLVEGVVPDDARHARLWDRMAVGPGGHPENVRWLVRHLLCLIFSRRRCFHLGVFEGELGGCCWLAVLCDRAREMGGGCLGRVLVCRGGQSTESHLLTVVPM